MIWALVAVVLFFAAVIAWRVYLNRFREEREWDWPEGYDNCTQCCPNMGACDGCDLGFP